MDSPLQKTRIVKAIFKPIITDNDTELPIKQINKDYSQDNIMIETDIPCINNFEPKYFTNTLFNIPNISEIDIQGNLITVEEPEYEFKNLTPSISDNNVYYNLHLRVKFHLYKKTPSTKKEKIQT